MKRSGIMISVFLAALLVIAAVCAYAFIDTGTVSEKENRDLAKRPALTESSWFSGEFATGMEDFLSDHVFRRQELVGAAQHLEELMGRKGGIRLVTHDSTEMGAGSTAGSDTGGKTAMPGESAAGTGTVTATGGENAGEAELQDRLVLDDRILQIYTDAPDALSYYAKTANSFFGLFPDYINKYCLVAPSRIAFETADVAGYSDDQREAIAYVYDKLDPIVTTVDAYSALEAHSGRLDDLYYRTDHHWTQLAAYYAFEAMANTAGLEYSPVEQYTRNEGNPFLGYFYAQDPSTELEGHKDELIYYLPNEHSVPGETLFVPNTDGVLEEETGLTVNVMRGGYYTFTGSSFSYVVMDGAKDDGSCILLVADSYGNAFSTWLAENYDTVIQIDPRDYTGGRDGIMALAEEYGVTDVMLCDYLCAINTMYFTSQIQNLTE